MTWKVIHQLPIIVSDEMFVGTSITDLKTELKNNTWYISMSLEERKALTVDDLINFFDQVIANREGQLSKKPVEHGMYFYMWHDRQASQLRFSLISDLHSELPFSARISQTSMEEIVIEFLRYYDDFPYSALEIQEATQENIWEKDNSNFVVNVYQKHLRPS